MSYSLIEATPSAYTYPLLIKSLLQTSLTSATDQEIVYADRVRYDYRTLRQRVCRLASALTDLGIRPGNTVGVLDWDSHRYLECYFAVPSMGAVLHMVNVRLSPEQILYTINHADDDILLVHADFLPLLESIRDRIERVRTIVLLSDDGRWPATTLELSGEYEELLAASSPDFAFPDFDENTRATTFYTTGTTGLPKEVNFSHRQLVLHTLAVAATSVPIPCKDASIVATSTCRSLQCSTSTHGEFPYIATMLGVKQVYPGRYTPELLVRLFVREKVTFSHCVPTLLHMMLTCPEGKDMDMRGWKVVIGGSALSQGSGTGGARSAVSMYSRATACRSLPGPVAGTSPSRLAVRRCCREKTQPCAARLAGAIPLVELQIVGPDGGADAADGQSAGGSSPARPGYVGRLKTRPPRPSSGRVVICTPAISARLTNAAGCRSPIAPRT